MLHYLAVCCTPSNKRYRLKRALYLLKRALLNSNSPTSSLSLIHTHSLSFSRSLSHTHTLAKNEMHTSGRNSSRKNSFIFFVSLRPAGPGGCQIPKKILFQKSVLISTCVMSTCARCIFGKNPKKVCHYHMFRHV